ncbi:MAG: UvrABC system protein B [Candidatus Omnitrophica bacterium]|nr:UvrABC system protein B [Candidatus Omnitrophota bacterium]
MDFMIRSTLKPTGDQPQAIDSLTAGVLAGDRAQTLLGVTGSGKTFTIANVIARVNRPTLVLSHNKTLAAQLYGELRDIFPENAVEYFVSYYDYYQPEAYVPATDTYIEKDSSINEDIDRLRLRATSNLLSRRDCIVVASVSAIYGLGSPAEYKDMLVLLKKGSNVSRDEVLKRLVDIQYDRNDVDFKRGTFRVRGDVVEVFPAYEETAVRIQLEWDAVARISRIDPLTGEVLHEQDAVAVYPAKHFVTSEPRLERAILEIEEELASRFRELNAQNKLVEAQRLDQRTRYDIEMMRELGYCSGIENYSRIITGRPPGSRPYCLLDYFPEDFLLVVDESHITVPQVRGMYAGDRARKETLVEYGFRLPSALDNRPLKYEEFDALVRQVVYVSATPGDFEIGRSERIVRQVIRPTGLLDPLIEVRPTKGQIDDLLGECRKRVASGERVIVTTLTKRMAEDLSKYLEELGTRVKYLHSEIDAIQRVELLRDLRLGKYDVIVGINLLREGIDLPEVSLVAVLDADKEGFLRSRTSLIQVSGRAARHVNGHVLFYADQMTDAMRQTIDETSKRRAAQIAYNKAHGITPQTIRKEIREGIESIKKARETAQQAAGLAEPEGDLVEVIAQIESEMEAAARELKFERAIELRDQLKELQKRLEAERPKAVARRTGGARR